MKTLKNGYMVKIVDYERVGLDDVWLFCYFPNGKLFEDVICHRKDVKGYVKQWESLF